MTAKVAAAFVKAQALVTGAKKSATNPHFKSKYADLAECFSACRHALSENDLAIIQPVIGERVQTIIVHASGETLSDEGVPLCGYQTAKNPMQALGSAITYARRYGLCAMVGISPEDDDGQSLTQDKPAASAWQGPLAKADLEAQITGLVKLLKDDPENVAAHVDKALPVINQCAVDLPEWAKRLDVVIKECKGAE